MMEVDDIPQISPNVDYNLIQPIHQKRTIAFVNHFIMNTVSFLNDFAASCESRLMQFEYKLQKIEASLLILESQLSSIPDLNDVSSKPAQVTVDLPEVENTPAGARGDSKVDSNVGNQLNEEVQGGNANIDNEKSANVTEESSEVKASADPRFAKYFKMWKVGIQAEAVKLKMGLDGVDPSILDNPNAVIPG